MSIKWKPASKEELARRVSVKAEPTAKQAPKKAAPKKGD